MGELYNSTDLTGKKINMLTVIKRVGSNIIAGGLI